MKEDHETDIYPSCDLCQYKGPNKSKIREHYEAVHLKARKKCELCNFNARRDSDIKNHKLVQHEGFRFKCQQCSFESSSRIVLKTHTRHTHLKVCCNICSVIYVGEKQLSEHRLVVHEDRMINCPDCDFKSCVKKEIQLHENIKHPKLKSYNCSICEYATSHFDVFKRHVRNHNITFIYCDECEYKTQTKRTMKLHKVLNHILNERFNKFLSNLGNSHKKLLNKHNLIINSELSFRCSLCQLKLKDAQDMKAHQRHHIPRYQTLQKSNGKSQVSLKKETEELNSIAKENKDPVNTHIISDPTISSFEEGEVVKAFKPRGKYAKNKINVDKAIALSSALSEVTEQLKEEKTNKIFVLYPTKNE